MRKVCDDSHELIKDMRKHGAMICYSEIASVIAYNGIVKKHALGQIRGAPNLDFHHLTLYHQLQEQPVTTVLQIVLHVILPSIKPSISA